MWGVAMEVAATDVEARTEAAGVAVAEQAARRGAVDVEAEGVPRAVGTEEVQVVEAIRAVRRAEECRAEGVWVEAKRVVGREEDAMVTAACTGVVNEAVVEGLGRAT